MRAAGKAVRAQLHDKPAFARSVLDYLTVWISLSAARHSPMLALAPKPRVTAGRYMPASPPIRADSIINRSIDRVETAMLI